MQKYLDKSYFYLVHQWLWIWKLAFPVWVSSLLRRCCKVWLHCLHTWHFLWNVQDFDMSRHHLKSCSCSDLIKHFLVSLTWTVCSPDKHLLGKFTTWNTHTVISCCIKIRGRETTSRSSLNTPEGKFPVCWEKGEYSDRKQRENRNLDPFVVF